MVVNRVCVIIAVSLISPDNLKINAMFEEIAIRWTLTMMPVRESFIIPSVLAISVTVVHKLFTEYLSAASSYS